MSKVKVVMCPADRAPYVTNISYTLENMQKTVGGYIETCRISLDAVIVCDEQGRIKGKPENKSLPIDGFVGDCFIIGTDDDGEFTDLEPIHAAWFLKQAKLRWNRKKPTE